MEAKTEKTKGQKDRKKKQFACCTTIQDLRLVGFPTENREYSHPPPREGQSRGGLPPLYSSAVRPRFPAHCGITLPFDLLSSLWINIWAMNMDTVGGKNSIDACRSSGDNHMGNE